MQVPTNFDGLRHALQALGFADVLSGIDHTSPDAKDQCRKQIQWLFEQSAQTWQDKARQQKALSYLERFPWPSKGLASALRAMEGLSALLEEEQILRPVDVLEYEEDEDGDVHSIHVQTALVDAIRAIKAARALTLPWGRMNIPDFLKPKPKPKTLRFGDKNIPVIAWVDFNAEGAWDDSTSVVVVMPSDGTWYGPYASPALASRAAWTISSRGDSNRRKVPIEHLRMIAARHWPLLSGVGTNTHRFAATTGDEKHD